MVLETVHQFELIVRALAWYCGDDEEEEEEEKKPEEEEKEDEDDDEVEDEDEDEEWKVSRPGKEPFRSARFSKSLQDLHLRGTAGSVAGLEERTIRRSPVSF